jgi:hypothetical protein
MDWSALASAYKGGPSVLEAGEFSGAKNKLSNFTQLIDVPLKWGSAANNSGLTGVFFYLPEGNYVNCSCGHQCYNMWIIYEIKPTWLKSFYPRGGEMKSHFLHFQILRWHKLGCRKMIFHLMQLLLFPKKVR